MCEIQSKISDFGFEMQDFLIPRYSVVAIPCAHFVPTTGLNLNPSKPAVPLQIRGLIAKAVLLMQFLGYVLKRFSHLVKAFNSNHAAAGFFCQTRDAVAWALAKNVHDVAIIVAVRVVR